MSMTTARAGSPPARSRAQEALLDLGDHPGMTASTQLGTGAAVVVGGVFVVALRNSLDAKFSSDGELIRNIAAGEFSAGNDRSFQTVGDIYSLLGLQSFPTLASLLGYGLFVLFFLHLLGPGTATRLSPRTLLLTMATIGLGAVYLGDYSKDVWVLPVIAAFLGIRRVLAREVALAAGSLVYATFLRQYWFLVYGFYLVLRLVTLRGTVGRTARAAVAVITMLVVSAIVFPTITGSTLGGFRTAINVDRVGMTDAQSTIDPLIAGTGPVAEAANALLTQLTLYVPLPLLADGSPVYLGATIFLVALWFSFFRALAHDRVPSTQRESMWPAACLVISFTTVQCIFEPDYGSYLRHLTPVLLLVLSVLVLDDRRSGSDGQADRARRDARARSSVPSTASAGRRGEVPVRTAIVPRGTR